MSRSDFRRLRARVSPLEHQVEIADPLARYNDGGPARQRVYRPIKHKSATTSQDLWSALLDPRYW
jgi:hypothetical protein